jgi:hypothetical protein
MGTVVCEHATAAIRQSQAGMSIGSRRAGGKIRIDFNFIDAVKSSEAVLVRLG